MIDYDDVTIETTYNGQNVVDTLNGKIALEEGRGRLVVRDSNNVERTRVDILGITTSDTNGDERARLGIARDDGRSGIWDSKTGVDLRDEGI